MVSSPPPKTPWRSFQAEPPPKPKQGLQIGVLGGLAIAAGVSALGFYMLDWHRHTCDTCGHTWTHFGAFNLADEGSHRCGACGAVQWWKDGAPHVLHGSQLADRDGALPPPLPRLEAPIVPPALAGPPRSSYEARDTFEYDPRAQRAFADPRPYAYADDPRPRTYAADPRSSTYAEQLALAGPRERTYADDPRPRTYADDPRPRPNQRPPLAPPPSSVGALRPIAARRAAPSSTALTYQPRRMPPR